MDTGKRRAPAPIMEQHLDQLYESIYAASTLPAGVNETNVVALLAPLVQAVYESKTDTVDPNLGQITQQVGERFLRNLRARRTDEDMEFLQFQRQFAIRSVLHNYYECEQSDMTLAKLHEYLRPQWTHRPLTLDWLRKTLDRLGFAIVTVQKSERVVEMHSQKLARLMYIRRIQSLRQQKRNIIYFREVTICLRRTGGEAGGAGEADETNETTEEITVLFAANRTGLLNFAFLEMTGKTTDNFIEWLTIISENQPANSVLVIEPKVFSMMTKPTLFSAPALPSSFKYERLWRNYNTFVPNAAAEPVHAIEMLDFCWRHRDLMTMLRKPTVDYTKVLQDNGYEVIQLPCLHPELTPMQRIDFVALIDGMSDEAPRTMEAIRTVVRTRLDGSTADEWCGYFADVERVEGDFLRFEALLSEGDEVIEMDDSSDEVEFVDECRETLCLSDDDAE